MARDVALGRGGRPPAPAVRAPGEIQPAHRGGFFGFIGESIAELKKVEWPGQNQVIQGTVVVLVACIVVGSYLYLNDIVWKHVVSSVFLGK